MRGLFSRTSAVSLLVTAIAAAAALAIGPKRMLAWSGFAPADSRLVTGILVTGTAERPVVYATSSDPRIGGDEAARDLGLDTNSGMISRLTREGSMWRRTDLVRGLPRSEENHATNGLALDTGAQVLYVAQGGMTNQGSPSSHFAYTPEYALSGAILAVDLTRIRDRTYDVPTLDDDSRAGARDAGDPFGGNDGKNQGRLVAGGPVQLHARGFRNPYDIVLTQAGRLYSIDNGAASEWGGPPAGCTNAVREGGSYDVDTLHLLARGYYGGHANPTRGSSANTFNRDRQSPVDRANRVECRYVPAKRRTALETFVTSTNGITEYTASNFRGALAGDLLAVSFDQSLYRIGLNARGDDVTSKSVLHRARGTPLDVTAQGDDDPFPGTVWLADYSTGEIIVVEPADFAAARSWRTLAPSAVARQEVSFVELDGKLYLAGGRMKAHEVYDPAANSWRRVADLPVSVDHVQAVAVGGRIYYLGGLKEFPEPAVGDVQIYDPATNSFSRGAAMPRPRGAGGVAAHGGRVYYAGGLHEGEAVAWFDEYDPRTDRWSTLPDMPRARDHFHAVVVGDRLYVIGGRETEIDSAIAEIDVFDLRRRTWSTVRSRLPTPRGGASAVAVDGEIWVVGGEASDRVFGEVEIYDPDSDRWRVGDPLPTPRHGIQAATCNGSLYVVAGGAAPYGAQPTRVLEAFPAGGPGCGKALVAERSGSKRVAFRIAPLAGTQLTNPTSLQFGPDGRLYVAQQDGTITVLSVQRTARGRYEAVDAERITLVKEIENHNDDGRRADDWRGLVRAVRVRLGI